jgi:succinate-semialdehyde dehydrogenase/glutarate-semialdehyde dehydrogenase
VKLADPTLFRQQMLIGGEWRDAADGATFDIRNPANAETVGHAPRSTTADVERAIEAAHAAFAACAAMVSRLTVAEGFAPGVEIGALISTPAPEKVEAHIADALAHGATLLTGGTRHALGGLFFQPTVLSHCTPDMALCRDETFGPVAPLIRFTDEAGVIGMANDTDYGLAAYAYTRDLRRAWRLAERLDYGMVGINAGLIATAEAAFGGVRQAGLGCEGGRRGIDEYLESKYVNLGGLG